MKYEIEIRHGQLNKYQVVRGNSYHETQQKATTKLAQWDEQYAKRLELKARQEEAKRRRAVLDDVRSVVIAGTQEAKQLTLDAQAELKRLDSILDTLVDVGSIKVDKLKEVETFNEEKPNEPAVDGYPVEPDSGDQKYQPTFKLIDHVFPWRKARKTLDFAALFGADHHNWKLCCREIDVNNETRKSKYDNSLLEWEEKRNLCERKNRSYAEEFEALLTKVEEGDETAVVTFFSKLIESIELPDLFRGDSEVGYQKETKTLAIDLSLPNIDDFPKINQVKFNTTTGNFEEINIKHTELEKLYDNACYQMVLGALYVVSKNDRFKIVSHISLNGWVSYVSKATGLDTTACILSVHVPKDELLSINLRRVDSKVCFRSLKGVANPKIHELTPVKPILDLNRKDRRFVPSRETIERIGKGTNIAAIGWEEFEHLIREIFEREFSSGGGEVKVTQASRDGGVDAVAFDPDPIRGGKIVIQAKRYTNTVDVSAVRDLYGTILNEGATKGILVTTSTFGADSYGFAKDKPITLLDGNHLLYLLEKHGHRASIDLVEAKRLGNALHR